MALAAGNVHTCALAANGQVQCWGHNGSGQLGNGSNTDSTTPVAVSGLSNAIALAAGGFHTCALEANGQVQCWGWNRHGQLGNGSYTESANTPVAVSGLSDVVALAAALSGGVDFAHTCALEANGQVRCWGSNGGGQLGNGSNANSNLPVAVLGLSNAIALAAGAGHTCALEANGQAQCWGYNGNGQLGDGSNTSAYTPLPVRPLLWASSTPSVAAVAATGTATGLSGGVSAITASFDGASGSTNLTVIGGCIQSPPSLNVQPSSLQGTAGTTLAYFVTLVNNDSADCPARNLVMSGGPRRVFLRFLISRT